MRRYITLMVSAMVLLAIGFSSSTAKAWNPPTEMYLYGDFDDNNKWSSTNTSDMVQMTKITNNWWKVKITWSTAYFRIFTKSQYENNYGSPDGNNDSDLTSSSKDVPSDNHSSQGEGSAFSANNLKDKYIYVKWQDNNEGCFTVSVVDESIVPDKIYLYGNVGEYDNKWNETELSESNSYPLTKSTKDGKTVYTGKVTFKKDKEGGKNYFRFWDGLKQVGPDPDSPDKEITLGFPFYTKEAPSSGQKAFYYTATKDITCDVELVYNGPRIYTVTISNPTVVYPDKLYLFSRGANFSDKPTLIATLNGDGKGAYTASSTVNASSTINKGTTYQLFISDLSTGNNWDAFNDHRLSPGSDQTITNTGSQDLVLSNNGVVKYTANSEGDIKFTLTLNDAASAGKFGVALNQGYYLSGDINDWATKDNEGADLLDSYKFTPVPNDDSNITDKSGWYVLNVPSMHGQFKIHTGGWNRAKTETEEAVYKYENWGSSWTRTTGTDPYAEMTYSANLSEIHDYLDKSAVAESMPTSANLGHQLQTEDKSFFNLRCAHNYYEDAYIYFNPTENKLFIKGTSKDIYVYYYSDEDKAGNTEIYIKEDASHADSNHYYYDDRESSTKLDFVSLTDTEREIPALSKVPVTTDGSYECYKQAVPAGLEEEFMVGGVNRYFEFYLAKKSGETLTDKDIFNGHDVYYINTTGALPYVLFNCQYPVIYIKEDGSKVTEYTEYDKAKISSDSKIKCDIERISYRLIAINAIGVPEYIKKDGTRTTKRSEANTYTLDYQLTNGQNGFTATQGSAWYGVSKTTTTQGLVAKATTDWTSNVEPVKSGDVYRYVEFDIMSKDSESDSKPGEEPRYHQFISDFVLTDHSESVDNQIIEGRKDGSGNYDIDMKAQMTGKLMSGRESNPLYKLNGTDLYATAQTSIPTAVEEIPVDNNEYDNDANAETVYYNLQGVRVNNPDRGIYIMVKGKTSKKVRF